MKNIVSRFLRVTALLAACLVLAPLAQGKKLNIVTSTADLASLTQEVGGDRISVESIARGYQDPHFVEAKPSFLLKLRHADLLIARRLGTGDWVATAADYAERQSTHSAERRRLPGRLPVC